MTFLQLLVYVLVFAAGVFACDIYWTRVKSDVAAAAHFARDHTLSNIKAYAGFVKFFGFLIVLLLLVSLLSGCSAVQRAGNALNQPVTSLGTTDQATSAPDDYQGVGVQPAASTTEAGSQMDYQPTPVPASCRHLEWLQEAMAGTKGESELIAVLNRDFVAAEGGNWSEPGYTVRGGNVFWTDLGEGYTPPAYVKRIRTQGNWGVYATGADFVIPSPNGGGRHVVICEGVENIPTQTGAVKPAANGKSTTPTAQSTTGCVTSAQMSAIAKSDDPQGAYNTFFEKAGYGKGVDSGAKVPKGFFLGTFQADKIPGGVENLAKGFIWKVDQEGVTSPNGGRWMPICK